MQGFSLRPTGLQGLRALTALALFSLAAGVQAQVSTKVYALLDAGISRTSVSGKESVDEFITGGYAPNYVGVTAEKNMGGVYAGGFRLEQGFLLSAPSPNTPCDSPRDPCDSRYAFGDTPTFANRKAHLYLKGVYGTTVVGTQSNMVFDSVLLTEPRYGANHGSALAGLVHGGGLSTVDTAISFLTYTNSGFTFGAAYVPTSLDVRYGSRFTLRYAEGPFKGMASYYETLVTSDARRDGRGRNGYGTLLGFSRQLGEFELRGLFARQISTQGADIDTAGVGGVFSLNGPLSLDVGAYRTQTEGGRRYAANTLAAGLQYRADKEITFYAQNSSVTNDGRTPVIFNMAPLSAVSSDDGGRAGNWLARGKTANTFMIGMLYSF